MVNDTQPGRGDDTGAGSRWAPDRSPDEAEAAYIDDIPAPQPVAPRTAPGAAADPEQTSDGDVRTRRLPQLTVRRFSVRRPLLPALSRPRLSRPRLSRPQLSRPNLGRISLDPRVAAALAGALVGAVLLGLTAIGLQGCQLVSGTSSCGTGPGFVGLLVIFVLAVVAGRALLAYFALPDPGSTSFLGVALTSVVALLFLIDVLDSPVMIVVIPVVTALTFTFSWWLTTRFVEVSNDEHR